MELIIKGDPKELAAFVIGIQKQPGTVDVEMIEKIDVGLGDLILNRDEAQTGEVVEYVLHNLAKKMSELKINL